MRIVMTKGSGGTDRLACHRAGGSSLHVDLPSGTAYHDLAHFVVERHFGMREGFWGRIAEGYSIAEYDLPNETRPFPITPEGYAAEFLATLVQSAVPMGSISPAYLDMLRAASRSATLPFPDLPSDDVLRKLISEAQAFTREWEALPPGGELDLDFPG